MNLADILSAIDSYKRVAADNVQGLLSDPAGTLARLIGPAQATTSGGLLQNFNPRLSSADPAEAKAAKDFLQNQAPGLLGAIKVYHGSPHVFDKFDMSKIGTGEGAQAFGHGLYFAENPNTANAYRESLAGTQVTDRAGNVLHNVEPGTLDVTPEGRAALALEYGVNASRGADPYPVAHQGLSGQRIDEARDAALRVLQSWREQGAMPQRGGGLYETQLRWPDPAREAADPLGPQHFLDWDKPLGEQAQSVASAIPNLVPVKVGAGRYGVASVDPSGTGRLLSGIGGETPEAAMSSVTTHLASGSGSSAYGTLSRWLGTQGSSDALTQAGIPGIRYLDAGSRAAGNGTANYVIFDDALAQILSRNGQPVGLLGQ